jgi:hypothetical protein
MNEMTTITVILLHKQSPEEPMKEIFRFYIQTSLKCLFECKNSLNQFSECINRVCNNDEEILNMNYPEFIRYIQDLTEYLNHQQQQSLLLFAQNESFESLDSFGFPNLYYDLLYYFDSCLSEIISQSLLLWKLEMLEIISVKNL